MSGTRSPWSLAATLTNGPHPFNGLPHHIAAQLVADGADLVGNRGVVGYFNNFMHWEGPVAEGTAGGWTLSGVTGAGTVVLTNALSGEIALTSDVTANADPTLQLGNATLGANYRYVVGKRLWCGARLKMLTVASTEFLFGLATPDTEPTVTNTFPADGIFFEKAAAATALDFHARKDGTSTERTLITPTVLADATYTTILFYVDDLGNIFPYQNGVFIPAGAIARTAANLPSAAGDVLQLLTGFRGASLSVTYDWILVAQEL